MRSGQRGNAPVYLSKHLNICYCISEVLIGNTMTLLPAVHGKGMRGQWIPFLNSD